MCVCMLMGLFSLQVQPDSAFPARMSPAEHVMGFVIFLRLLDFSFCFPLCISSRHVAMAMCSTWSIFCSTERI